MNILRKLQLLRAITSTWSGVEGAVRKYRENRSKGMTIKLRTNLIVQILALLLQGLNQIASIVPDEYKFWLATAVGFIQLVYAVAAHFSNPDATAATTAYVPPVKTLKLS